MQSRAIEAFAPERLLEVLSALPAATGYVIGFSGGGDSTALLYAATEVRKQLSGPLSAIHFNHRLDPAAEEWQRSCTETCEDLGVPLLARTLDLRSRTGKSPETSARMLRYAEVARQLPQGAMYLTAHHADDEAETLIFHLVRGSGIEGLAAIPRVRKLGRGWVGRPLLDFRRASLEAYLEKRGIGWIIDPSNDSACYDRNFIRREILPRLDVRWPGVVGRINRSARLARRISEGLWQVMSERLESESSLPRSLPWNSMRVEPLALKSLLVRQWLRDQEVPMPPETRLVEFFRQTEASESNEARPELRWRGWAMRRFGGRLWLQPYDRTFCVRPCRWEGIEPLDLGDGLGQLVLTVAGLPPTEQWSVSPRRNRARLPVSTDGARRSIKDLLRESGAPPWLREGIPVLWRGQDVMAVGDWWLHPDFCAWLESRSASYYWRPDDPVLLAMQSVCQRNAIDRLRPLG